MPEPDEPPRISDTQIFDDLLAEYLAWLDSQGGAVDVQVGDDPLIADTAASPRIE